MLFKQLCFFLLHRICLIFLFCIRILYQDTSLVVHWLRLQKASNARKVDLIPDQGIKIPHAA